MSKLGAFQSGGVAAVALTTANVSVATAAAVAGDGETMVIVNNTAVLVLVSLDTSAPTVSASAWQYAVPAGGRAIVSVPRGTALFAAAMPIALAAANVYFMRGEGSSF